jgi:hypothetical protein
MAVVCCTASTLADNFFPVTELDDIDNVALLVNGMFPDILAKRTAGPKEE